MKLGVYPDTMARYSIYPLEQDDSDVITAALDQIYAADTHLAALQVGLQEIVQLVGARRGVLLVCSPEPDDFYPLLACINGPGQPSQVVEPEALLNGAILGWSQAKVTQWASLPLMLPLKIFGHQVGVIHLDQVNYAEPAGQKQAAVETLTRQLALILENSQLLRLAKERQTLVEMLTTAGQIGQRLSASTDVEQSLGEFLESCRVLLDAERCFILIVDGETETLRLLSSNEVDPLGQRLPEVTLHNSLAGWVARTGKASLVADVQLDLHYNPAVAAAMGLEVRQLIYVPLSVQGQALGVVAAVNKLSGDFDRQDLNLLQMLAPSAAIALANAHRLAWQRAEAEQKTELYSVASHALRSPMMSILTSVEWILETGVRNKAQRTRLEDIRAQILSLAKFAGAILDMSRVEAENLRLQLAPVAVAPLIKKTLAAFERRAPTHRFELQMIQPVPPAKADETQLSIILDHLLENAVKYSPAGRTVSVEIETTDEQVRVSVCDQGSGILPDELEDIFSRYYRGRHQPAKDHSLGLGLYIVRKLVRAQGGDIWVDSTVGCGSRFTFTLPQVKVGESYD